LCWKNWKIKEASEVVITGETKAYLRLVSAFQVHPVVHEGDPGPPQSCQRREH